jgi:Ca2+-binding EF-hand superfamily protein
VVHAKVQCSQPAENVLKFVTSLIGVTIEEEIMPTSSRVKWYLALSLVGAIVLIVSSGWGREEEGVVSRIRFLLETLDHNQDGKVSPEEFPGSADRFQRLDTDGDGYLTVEDFGPTAEEVEQKVHSRIAEVIAKHDQNRDGMLSREEFPGSTSRFQRLDANGDGLLSQAEFEAGVRGRFQEFRRKRRTP